MFVEHKSFFQSLVENYRKIGRQPFYRLKQATFQEIMNRKEATVSLVIVGIAILASIMTTMMSMPTQAIATLQAYRDASYLSGGGYVEDVTDSSGTSDNADKEAEVSIGEEDSSTAPTTDEDEDEEGTADSNGSSNDR